MNNNQTQTIKGSILIVDDTPNNLRLLSSMLAQQGHEVRSAISGSAALMAVKTTLPDLILLDVNMPRMNGYEVCRWLKTNEATREIPVIFLSAMGEAIDKVKAFQIGGIDYITKPFYVEEVLVRINNQLKLRQMQADLQRAEAEALRALAQEKELNRLKSEFMSMLSHDFRTPLTSIQGFSGLLRHANQTLSSETQERYFDKIDAAIAHMLYLLDEILLLGGIDAGKTQCQLATVNLEQFCQDLTETVQLSMGSQHKLVFTCPTGCPTAEVDKTLLQRIFTNLLSNAIKYSPAGSTVQFALNCQAGVAQFQVIDKGIGIPLEAQDRLFETFYRCNNVGQVQGTGLGLAVVKRCVEAHYGKVYLNSEEGVGTTVTVEIPLLSSNSA